jgi:hypothetical protein
MMMPVPTEITSSSNTPNSVHRQLPISFFITATVAIQGTKSIWVARKARAARGVMALLIATRRPFTIPLRSSPSSLRAMFKVHPPYHKDRPGHVHIICVHAYRLHTVLLKSSSLRIGCTPAFDCIPSWGFSPNPLTSTFYGLSNLTTYLQLYILL